jgi:glucan 1,3-beta-glucosidase
MMATFSFTSLLVALRLFLLASAAPAPFSEIRAANITMGPHTQAASASSYWLSSIARQGTVAYGSAGFQIFRNVKDFGARGDGMFYLSSLF